MNGTYIFVCDRGFVIAGEARLDKQLALCWRLRHSCTIRRWGTTNGLAQLQDSPLPETILDAVCERTIPFRSVIDIIHLTEEGRRRTPLSLGQIGAYFGGRDHSTVLHACKKVEEELARDASLSGALRELHAELA